MKTIIFFLLISINGFGQKIDTNAKVNYFGTAVYSHGDIYKYENGKWEKEDTLRLATGLSTVPNWQPAEEDEIDSVFINGTNYIILMRIRKNALCFDSMWLYIKPNLINGSSFGKVHTVDDRGSNETFGGKPPYNNSYMSSANMRNVSPFDELQDMRLGQFNYYKPQSKTDTVKGIITYYKYLSKTDIYHHYMLVQLPAIAIYKIDSVFEQYTEGTYLVLLSRWRKTRELLKILVNNKPFDLSKHYEFLRDDEIVK